MAEDEIRNIDKYPKLWRTLTFIKYKLWRVTDGFLNLKFKSLPFFPHSKLSQTENAGPSEER